MNEIFLAVLFVFLSSSGFSFADNTKCINSNWDHYWTHYVEAVDWDAKVILLNDGSRFELIEGFEDGWFTEVTKKDKKTNVTTILHKKGYPTLLEDLWEKGKPLKLTRVYLDKDGLIVQPNYFSKLEETSYFMLYFFDKEVESTIYPGSYAASYHVQGPFVQR